MAYLTSAANEKLCRLVEVHAERLGELEKLREEVRRVGSRQAEPCTDRSNPPSLQYLQAGSLAVDEGFSSSPIRSA